MQFDKMHGLGNDFVFIKDTENAECEKFKRADFLKKICDRHLGIGCDLVVIYKQKSSENFEANFFNADGTQAEICGNAARCLGKLIAEKKHVQKINLRCGEKKYSIEIHGENISVNMGQPKFSPELIGLPNDDFDFLNMQNHVKLPKNFADIAVINMACVSIGNPHLVIFFEKLAKMNLINALGKFLEKYPLFKNRINVSFAEIPSPDEISLVVFERGVGVTQACGSGATATAYLAWRKNFVEAKKISVHQAGGDLIIYINDDESVTQSGSATYVFSGNYENY